MTEVLRESASTWHPWTDARRAHPHPRRLLVFMLFISMRQLPAALAASFCLLVGAQARADGPEPAPVRQLQPLAHFLAAAAQDNRELRVSRAQAGQKNAEAVAALGKLLPALDVAATYTRNAYLAQFPAGPNGQELILVPLNQLDASVALTVPLIDIVSWARLRATRALSDAAQAQMAQVQVSVAAAVAMRYFALLGQEGLQAAAERRQAVSQESLKWLRARYDVGSSSSLDLARAESDLAQAQQDRASAKLQVEVSRRALATLTGVEPDPGGALGEVPLTAEAPLSTWLARVDDTLPAVAQARAQEKAARAAVNAAKLGYLPMLSARGTERVTNASGLNGGHTTVWSATANLTWHLDASLTPTEQAQGFARTAAAESRANALRQAADRVFQDHAQVQANLAKSAAARKQVAATSLGATWAQDKLTAGIVTQLEVSQAQRDAFAAEAARIQADTDLLYYRAMLRLDAGAPATHDQDIAP